MNLRKLQQQVNDQGKQIKQLQQKMYEPILTFDQAVKTAKTDFVKFHKEISNGKIRTAISEYLKLNQE